MTESWGLLLGQQQQQQKQLIDGHCLSVDGSIVLASWTNDLNNFSFGGQKIPLPSPLMAMVR